MQTEAAIVSSRYRQQIAPLASLDCSITEPIADNQSSRSATNHQQSRPHITDTPTISSYFDCDQLSDRVDDSLFEITNAGCLSKFVFSKGSLYQVDGGIQQEPDQQPLSIIEDDSGRRTPTNEPDKSSTHDQPVDSPVVIKADQRDNRRTSQVAMLANYEPYDYSSTSSVPAQVRAPSKAQGQRPRSSVVKQMPDSDSTNLRHDLQVSSEKSAGRAPHRKTRSNPVTRDEQVKADEEEFLCLKCAGSAEKKANKRFSFNPFTFFARGSSSSVSKPPPCECKHHQSPDRPPNHSSSRHSQAAGKKSEYPAGEPSTAGEPSGPRIRSRDSIKITNQRRQRDSVVKVSNSCNDFNLGSDGNNNELLLDLSQIRKKTTDSVAPSCSCFDIKDDMIAGTEQSAKPSVKSQCPTKSVKFITPDEVRMIRPNKATNKYHQQGATNPKKPINIQPSAPIIKKVVSKSSQTESSVSLDKLLAKCEGDIELIKEIKA